MARRILPVAVHLAGALLVVSIVANVAGNVGLAFSDVARDEFHDCRFIGNHATTAAPSGGGDTPR